MAEKKRKVSAPHNLGNLPKLPIDQISTGKWNVRTLDREKGIEELAESILKYGLLQPVVVVKDGDKTELIIGQRRLLAFKELIKQGHSEFSEIPAIILEKKPDEEKLKILSLSENIHRVELNRADIVEVISYLYKKYNKSPKKVASILGKSIPYVYDHLKIQDAPDEVKQMLSRKELTKEDVKRVMQIAPDNKDKMISLAKEMKKLTTYERKRLAEIGKIKSKAEVGDLVKEAKKPHIEEKIIVPLTPILLKALDTAVKDIGLTREEVAKKALEEWLGSKGYFKE
jgi:ParB family chromosome partitioning protein